MTGYEIDTGRLTEIFFELKEKGANNINLVTADIHLPLVREAIINARRKGLNLPFILNTSSYVNAETIKSLDGLIDVYLPDFKYIRDDDAIRYSAAPSYPDAAKAAIDEMVRQQPECVFKNVSVAGDSTAMTVKPLIEKGVIVRHLLLPGKLIEAKLIVHYLHERYNDKIFISLMNQYTPNGHLEDFPEIDRRVSEYEYKSLIDYASSIGVTNGYMQVGETASESFIPAFDCTGVLHS